MTAIYYGNDIPILRPNYLVEHNMLPSSADIWLTNTIVSDLQRSLPIYNDSLQSEVKVKYFAMRELVARRKAAEEKRKRTWMRFVFG